MSIRFDNKVVIVTGAGGGLGKQYALFFASRGAKVVVNDLGGSTQGQGSNTAAAQVVVDEIKKNGGEAVANFDSVEFGEKIVKTALDNYGRVDVVINNAGILRDVSFQKMKEVDWDLIMKVHLKGMYSVSRAAWNVMREQKYGRIVNTASSSGLYGNFGQANYATAKLGTHGFTQTLAKEGEKRNIFVNTIAPVAASRMTATTMPEELLKNFGPEHVVPLVAYLASDKCQENGSVFEVAGGYIAKLRFQRTQGALFDLPYTPEDVASQWENVISFDRNNDYPTSGADTFQKVNENLERIKANKPVPKAAQAGGQQAASGQPLKSDAIFTLIQAYFAKGDGQATTKKLQSVYQIDLTLKKGGPVVKSFTIDLKNGNGSASVGKPPKCDATFQLVDNDFFTLCQGKLNPQQAFMTGKMKIKGNMAKATKFTPDLFPAPTPANFQKYGVPAPKL